MPRFHSSFTVSFILYYIEFTSTSIIDKDHNYCLNSIPSFNKSYVYEVTTYIPCLKAKEFPKETGPSSVGVTQRKKVAVYLRSMVRCRKTMLLLLIAFCFASYRSFGP